MSYFARCDASRRWPMPDWHELVSQRLAGIALEHDDRQEVVAELAAHLEETFEAFCREGLAAEDAIRRALSQVNDWKDLQRRIQTARTKENSMTPRVKCLWLPGLLTFALCMALLDLVQKFGPAPLVLNLEHPPVLMFYTRWLLMLPFAGAIGAYLSSRAGGSIRMVLLTSIFPVLPFAVVFLIAIPAGLLLSSSLAHHIVAASFLSLMTGWVLAPGIVLLAGGIAVHLAFSRRSTPGQTATN